MSKGKSGCAKAKQALVEVSHANEILLRSIEES